MDQITLKFECLRLAKENHSRVPTPEEVVKAAQQFYDFAMGENKKDPPKKKRTR